LRIRSAMRRDRHNGPARALCFGAWCAGLGLLLVLLGSPGSARAYSALTHEAIVDSVWTDTIAPLLRKRYAGVSDDELREARAYGGCVIQDMGYYPFGAPLFTDLVHYVRSGDFAVTLIDEAQPIEEYAFALGALEHYLADSIGHPNSVNRAVPLEYPALRQRFGQDVTWVDDPSAHLKVEFGFDVTQVAHGHYLPQSYHDFIGFKVATPLLERAFFKVYGLELSDVF